MTEQFADSFALADEPQAIAASLIGDLDEFAHLGLARIAFVFSERSLFLGGDQKAAIIGNATNVVRGPLRHLLNWLVVGLVEPLFDREEPDFLVLVDHPHWQGLDAEGRERLVFHELKHVVADETDDGTPKLSRDDGRPMLKLRGHDAEAFNTEIERYGVEVCGLEDTAIAIAEGERLKRARSKRTA